MGGVWNLVGDDLVYAGVDLLGEQIVKIDDGVLYLHIWGGLHSSLPGRFCFLHLQVLPILLIYFMNRVKDKASDNVYIQFI